MSIKQDVKKILLNLLRFDTSIGHVKNQEDILKYIISLFKKYPELEIKIFKEHHNLIISNNPKLKDERALNIILTGHLDVVPGTYKNAFAPYIKGNKVYGRGTSDMKGPVAALIVAFLTLLSKNINKKIILMLTMDEETGGEHGVKELLFKHNINGDIVFLPDGGDNWHIITHEKGVLRIELKAKGVSAHGAYLWSGKNAIEILMNFYGDFKKQFVNIFGNINESEDKWLPSLNIGVIKGGLAPNQVPDLATALLDIRYTNLNEREGILNLIQQAKAKNPSIFYEVYEDTLPTKIDFKNKYIKQWVSTIQKKRKNTNKT